MRPHSSSSTSVWLTRRCIRRRAHGCTPRSESSSSTRPFVFDLLHFTRSFPNALLQATAKAQEDIKRILEVLNGVLETRTFLVGERITLADITLATSLLQLYQQVNFIQWHIFKDCANLLQLNRCSTPLSVDHSPTSIVGSSRSSTSLSLRLFLAR